MRRKIYDVILILFQDSSIANLLRLIQKMKPKQKEKSFEEAEREEDKKVDVDLNRKLFPGLALADDPNVRVSNGYRLLILWFLVPNAKLHRKHSCFIYI